MANFYERVIPKPEEPKVLAPEPVMPKFHFSEAEIDAILMLRLLARRPFMRYGELTNELELTPARGDKARAWMVNSGLVKKAHSITLRRGKPGIYFELTDRAYKKFGGEPPFGRGGFRHKSFAHTLKDHQEDRGFTVQLEGVVEGKAFDVLAEKEGQGKFGYEVTIHFQNLIQNLREGLRTSVTKIVVVCANKDAMEQAKLKARKELGDLSRIEFKTIFEFTHKEK
jgi:hypothetical protein